MADSYWRERYRPLIAQVLRETAGQKDSQIKAALREAFPSGQRSLHPYKMWLKEIRFQRGLEKDKRRKKGETLPVESCAGQMSLLESEAAK